MLLEIATTLQPATDLGFLLNKHPDRLQTIDLAVGQAHVFYPEVSNDHCRACLLVDVNPLDLTRDKGNLAFLQEHYVNDRPYTSNSFLGTAIVKMFRSALNGTSTARPDLVSLPIPLRARVHALKVPGEKIWLNKLFEPFGYEVSYETSLLDEKFPSWGESPTVTLTLNKITTVQALLSQLYILILALDNDRHYWISRGDIDTLMAKGEGWLKDHPEREWITKRFLKNLRSFTSQALLQLAGEEEETELVILPVVTVRLHQLRLETAFDALRKSGATSVLDLGCGEGKLLKLLIRSTQFRKITGMDVSMAELRKARENLFLETASPLMRERVNLFQGSVTYKDARMKGFDAAALVEVIEHLDEERLEDMAKVVFGVAKPGTVVITTPNAEYNSVYGQLDAGSFRHADHRFEWTRPEFQSWSKKIALSFGYTVDITPIGPSAENVGSPSQMAVFIRNH